MKHFHGASLAASLLAGTLLGAAFGQIPAPQAGSGRGSTASAHKTARESPIAVTADELRHLVESLHEVTDHQAAQRLAALVLSERLTARDFAALDAKLPGAHSRLALLALADASMFQKAPASAFPPTTPPSDAEQRHIQASIVRYLETTIPNLPNLFAKQNVIRFGRPEQDGISGPWHAFGTSTATLFYRHGAEAQEAAASEGLKGFVTEGIFGPILSMLSGDVLLPWTFDHWEQESTRKLAVFRYDVKEEKSRFAVMCFVTPYELQQFTTAYHAEVAVDPTSGAILRLTVMADLNSSLSCRRADVMVQYGDVVLAGRNYICPLRSVEFSQMARISKHIAPSAELLHRDQTELNDITFSDYRVFRATTQILKASDTGP